MKQKIQQQQKQITRSLDRLYHFIKQSNIDPCIPAFYYTADLLQKHASKYGQQNVNGNLFHQFKTELQLFAQKLKEKTNLKTSQQQIFQEAYQITNGQLFMNCMRPDIAITRRTITENQRKTHLSYISHMSQANNMNLDEQSKRFRLSGQKKLYVPFLHKDQNQQQRREFNKEESSKKQKYYSQIKANEQIGITSKYKFGIPDHIINQGVQTFKKSRSEIRQSKQELYGLELPQKSKLSSQKSSNLQKKISKQEIYQKQFKQIQLAYQEHRIDQAYQMSRQFSIKNSKKWQFLTEKRKYLLETIQLQYQTMINFYRQFDTPGWIFDKQQKGIKLQYKMYEQERQIAIKIQGEFDVPVESFLAIICQVDLMGQYVPFCYDAKLVKWISRNQRIGTSKIYIPMLTDRETYFYATGYDRLKQSNSIFFYSKTINQDYAHHKRYNYQVPKESKLVRLEYKFFIIEYVPLSGSRAKVRLASNIDMKLNFLPNFILSVSARKFAFDYFKNIVKINKNFKGSEWQKLIKQKPEFYNFFKRKNQQYLEKGKFK